jgi:hypothetical protein
VAVSDLFYVHKHTKCPLSSKDALSLIVHIIENPDGGANLNLAKLVAEKRITVCTVVMIFDGHASDLWPLNSTSCFSCAFFLFLQQKYFALHDKRKLPLYRKWFKWAALPWQQPIAEIRSYFVRAARSTTGAKPSLAMHTYTLPLILTLRDQWILVV